MLNKIFYKNECINWHKPKCNGLLVKGEVFLFSMTSGFMNLRHNFLQDGSLDPEEKFIKKNPTLQQSLAINEKTLLQEALYT